MGPTFGDRRIFAASHFPQKEPAMRRILRGASVAILIGTAACSATPTGSGPDQLTSRRGPAFGAGVFIGGGMATDSVPTTSGAYMGAGMAAPPADSTERAGGVFIGPGAVR